MEKIKDNKKLVIIVAMVVIAIFVAIIIVKPFGGRDGVDVDVAGNVPSERTAVYILNDAPEGTVITEEMIDVKVVDDGVDINAFQYKEDVIGKETLKDIIGGSAIEYEDLEQEMEDPSKSDNSDSDKSSLASRVPENLRAVLMPTGPVQEIVGYLDEGDRIDIIITNTKGDGHVTSTPFKNLEVLLLGEGVSAPPPIPVPGEEEVEPLYTGGGSDVSSVILAMTPEQAETISNMRISGILETAQITIRSEKEAK